MRLVYKYKHLLTDSIKIVSTAASEFLSRLSQEPERRKAGTSFLKRVVGKFLKLVNDFIEASKNF
jgi:hypothetical protein